MYGEFSTLAVDFQNVDPITRIGVGTPSCLDGSFAHNDFINQVGPSMISPLISDHFAIINSIKTQSQVVKLNKRMKWHIPKDIYNEDLQEKVENAFQFAEKHVNLNEIRNQMMDLNRNDIPSRNKSAH
eukprot:NODE_77_length_23806_cov_0.393892.p15 type:complete len:128 gc:universal NODE_77_length_23806_cov_0.393892:13484-13101(-)